MKQTFKSVLGVTLLEIMLVLAIASMVVVMSLRYYQTATLNQKVNGALNVVNGMVAAAESYLSATGTLATVSGTDSTFLAFMPNSALPNSPWGGPVTVTAGTASTPNSMTFTMPSVPFQACNILTKHFGQNSKLSAGTCPSAGSGPMQITITE